MALIKTVDLEKTYKMGKSIETKALAGINLSIEKGAFFAIAGPSGSGKSSFLNLISALDTPTSGKILYDGTDITQMNTKELSDFRLNEIGFVFQAYNLISTLTALENVEYTMLLQNIDKKTRYKKSVDLLERVGLADYIHRFPNEMSGGQQQRIAVARAIVSEPKVVMADEPTANLDSKSAASLIELMQELNEEKKVTFVFSTHDQRVMDKAKQLVILKDGLIEN